MTLLVGIPVKPFTVAKARLSPVLDAPTRRRLGMAIAARTARCAAETGADVRIVTGDDGVAAWAERLGFGVLDEPPGGGLDGAAGAVAAARPDAWAVLHADLPLLSVREFEMALANAGPVIAPAHDGGTSLVKASGSFRFAYGPGSFQRHLAALPSATVVVAPGFALDLDTARDLDVARRVEAGRWLEDLLADEMAVTT